MTIPVTIEKVDFNDGPVLADFYQTVLRSNFSVDELETEEDILEGMQEGRTFGLLARSGDGVIVGGAIGDWYSRSKVMLFSYLAVPEQLRGNGIGTQILLDAKRIWTEDLAPLLIVVEVEDPRFYTDTGFGDPLRRVALYENTGCRSLPIPYLQPALRPGTSRVPHLLLMVFGGATVPPGAERVDGTIVEDFLVEYFELCEGAPSDHDPEYQALLQRCRQPGGLPLLLVKDLPPLSVEN